jgi:hypothetical protein
MMQGAHIAKQYVTAYLEQDMPARLNDFRNIWNLDDESLPDPLDYRNYEPLAIDRWPMVYTVAVSTNSFLRSDYDLGDPLYRTSYSMRTYIWVKDIYAEQATLMRDQLTTVLRASLLDHPCMLAGSANGVEPLVDEGSLREEFSDLTLIKGDRYMAGAFCAYTFNMNEVMTRRPMGELAEFNVEYETLPRIAGTE